MNMRTNRMQMRMLAVTGVIVLLAGGALAADMEQAYSKLLSYRPGQGPEALGAVHDEVRAASADQKPAVEAKLLAVLTHEKATPEAKQFVCRMLRTVGSTKSVAPLGELLTDAQVCDFARMALEAIGGADAKAALRGALGAASDEQKVGIVHSLGDMGDAEAVAQLAPLAKADAEPVARAAIVALGRIGNAPATAALTEAEATVPDALKRVWGEACLDCAARIAAAGQGAEAAKLYRRLFAEGMPVPVRMAALGGIAEAEQARAVPLMVGLLGGDDAALQGAAVTFLARMSGPEATEAVVAALPTASSDARVKLIAALEMRGDPAAAASIVEQMASDEQAVRIAAIKALGALGGKASIGPLLQAAAKGQPESDAARASLSRLKGAGVDEAILALIEAGDAERQAYLVPVVAARRCGTALPKLLALTGSDDRAVQAAAFEAAGELAEEKDLGTLLGLLVGAKDQKARDAAVDAAKNVIARTACYETATKLCIKAYGHASPPVKCGILAVLGRAGGDKSLAAVQRALGDEDATVRDAAVRALADWRDAQAAPELLKLATESDSRVHSILALRGYMRLAGVVGKRDTKRAAAMFGEAIEVAKRPDELKLALSGLGQVRHPNSLRLVAAQLPNEAVNAEACAAAVELARHLNARHRELVAETMKAVVESCKDKRVVARAKVYTGQ